MKQKSTKKDINIDRKRFETTRKRQKFAKREKNQPYKRTKSSVVHLCLFQTEAPVKCRSGRAPQHILEGMFAFLCSLPRVLPAPH